MLFDDWAGVLRVLVLTPLAFIGLVGLVRLTGKRTLSKLNAFDLVVTVALGSALATIILSKDVALVEGLLGVGLLVGLQLAVSWLSVRSATVRRLVKAEPRLLLRRGEPQHAAMRAERITMEEVLSAIRQQGVLLLSDVEAVVLETDGTLTVTLGSAGRGPSSLGKLDGSS